MKTFVYFRSKSVFPGLVLVPLKGNLNAIAYDDILDNSDLHLQARPYHPKKGGGLTNSLVAAIWCKVDFTWCVCGCLCVCVFVGVVVYKGPT